MSNPKETELAKPSRESLRFFHNWMVNGNGEAKSWPVENIRDVARMLDARADCAVGGPLPLKANCPYCDSGLVWTDEEAKAIADLSKRLELRPVQVIRQALRTYQLQAVNEFDLQKAPPKDK